MWACCICAQLARLGKLHAADRVVVDVQLAAIHGWQLSYQAGRLPYDIVVVRSLPCSHVAAAQGPACLLSLSAASGRRMAPTGDAVLQPVVVAAGTETPQLNVNTSGPAGHRLPLQFRLHAELGYDTMVCGRHEVWPMFDAVLWSAQAACAAAAHLSAFPRGSGAGPGSALPEP